MSDLQRYTYKFNLIKEVEDNVVFLTRTVLISMNFSIVPYEQTCHYCRETTNENKQFKKTKTLMLINT